MTMWTSHAPTVSTRFFSAGRISPAFPGTFPLTDGDIARYENFPITFDTAYTANVTRAGYALRVPIDDSVDSVTFGYAARLMAPRTYVRSPTLTLGLFVGVGVQTNTVPPLNSKCVTVYPSTEVDSAEFPSSSSMGRQFLGSVNTNRVGTTRRFVVDTATLRAAVASGSAPSFAKDNSALLVMGVVANASPAVAPDIELNPFVTVRTRSDCVWYTRGTGSYSDPYVVGRGSPP